MPRHAQSACRTTKHKNNMGNMATQRGLVDFMIPDRNPRGVQGVYGKSEKISPADPARRLVIEWTAQLPATRRNTVPR
jgi:hypothetical protein